jgi:hypothetical protein
MYIDIHPWRPETFSNKEGVLPLWAADFTVFNMSRGASSMICVNWSLLSPPPTALDVLWLSAFRAQGYARFCVRTLVIWHMISTTHGWLT